LRKKFEVSNHKFLTSLCDAIAKKLKDNAEIEMAQAGKKVQGHKIETTLIGQSADPDVNKDIEKRVKQTMDSLKNPTALADLLK
jgi:hypothetical protein